MFEDFEQIKMDFEYALEELINPSQHIIGALSMLCEENLCYASIYLDCILNRIKKTSFELKLPTLYLIDSIIKNIPTYRYLVEPIIVQVIQDIYTSVNEKTKHLIRKLKNTWNGIFLPETLHRIQNIFLNSSPERIKNQRNFSLQESNTYNQKLHFIDQRLDNNHQKEYSCRNKSPCINPIKTNSTIQKRTAVDLKEGKEQNFKKNHVEDEVYKKYEKQMLRKETEELTRLIQERLTNGNIGHWEKKVLVEELNRLAVPTPLPIYSTNNYVQENQIKVHNPTQESIARIPNNIPFASEYAPIVNSNHQTNNQLLNPYFSLNRPFVGNPSLIYPQHNPMNVTNRMFPVESSSPVTISYPNPYPDNQLLMPLPLQPPPEEFNERLINLSNPKTLSIRYLNVIRSLYDDFLKQCSTCGLRFHMENVDELKDHMDWHFRSNRAEKEKHKKVSSRRWFLTEHEWISFHTSILVLPKEESNYSSKENLHEEESKLNCPVQLTNESVSCDACNENFEKFWNEEEEEWYFKNAVRINNKIYHHHCSLNIPKAPIE